MILLVFNKRCNESKSKDQNYKNCYEIKNDYVYLNFYNNTNKDINLPNLANVVNTDFSLNKHYFKIGNDTLHIGMPNESHLFISHGEPVKEVNIEVPTIKLEKGKYTQQVFKNNDEFKYIVVDSYILLNECN